MKRRALLAASAAAGFGAIGPGIAAAEPPRVRFEAPADGATVSGVVPVEVRVDERDENLDRTDLFVNGELVTSGTTEQLAFSWDASGASGSQTLTATARDVVGDSSSASVTVTVESDAPPAEEAPSEEEEEDIPTLQSVTLSSSTVVGGGSATGFAAFDRAPIEGQGMRTFLSSSHPDIVQVPSETFQHVSETERAFDITTTPVASDVVATITVDACCVAEGQMSAELTVTADGEASTDVVEVTRARWEPGLLQVEATSTSTDALLTVYMTGDSGAEIRLMDLTHEGGGEYEGERVDDGRLSNPGTIEVRSNLGGSDTAAVEE